MNTDNNKIATSESDKMKVSAVLNSTVMSGFKEIKFNEIINKEKDSKDLLKKPTLTFKLQKSNCKLKTLQGSVTRAFPDVDQQVIETKTKLFKSSLLEVSDESDENKDSILSYIEPPWSGMPEDVYKMEIIKSGVILKTLDLSSKNYHVIGKSLSCDVCVTHETISPFHAILQYRKTSDFENEKGMYIYDLNSVNGTFLNGNRIISNTYIRLHGGYIISFGDSPRKYILQTPKDNEEKEAELSVAELTELRKLEAKEEERLENERLIKENEERLKKESEFKGIDWGIADDINENSASTETTEDSESDNEELFLENPKKALEDWFKWEGHDLEYQTEDRGFGQYSCWIVLTLDAVGNTETVEAHVVGDKTRAINECAVKACRVLNKYGLLRQAHEEKKSISKNWEEVDYYDSDEDNFFDRTGVVEKKRQKRLKTAGKIESQHETCNSLQEKHSKIVERIRNLENLIASQDTKNTEEENSEEDAVDAFMSKLETITMNKTQVRDIKIELHNLHQEEMLVSESINKMKLAQQAFSSSCSSHITEKTDQF